MTKFFQHDVFLLPLAFLALCLIYLSPPLIAQEEKFFCPFDERKWKVGFQESNSDQAIVEMILKDEEILNWTELFTVQKFEDLNITADEFTGTLEKTFKQNTAKDQELILKTFEPASLNIFESSFISKASAESKKQNSLYDEYNIGRVLKGEMALYYIRYSAKNVKTFEQNKQAWVERLRQAYLAPKPKENQEGHWLTFTNDAVYEGEEKLVLQANSQIITNQEAGFALSLPNDWLVDEHDMAENDFDTKDPYTIALIFSSLDQNIYGGVAFKKQETENQWQNILKSYFSLYKNHTPQVKLVDKGNIQTVLGEKGRYLILEDGEERGWITFFEKNHHLYRLELWAPKQQFESLKTDFERYITNFQVLNLGKD